MVLDSSACLDLVLETEPGRALRGLLLSPEPALLGPGLLWAEVARVLRAKAGEGALSRRAADAALSRRAADAVLADFLDLGVQEVPVEPLLVRAWQRRDNLTIDDAAFAALAEVTARPLLTTDLRLAHAARQYVHIDVVTHLDSPPL